MEYKLDNIIISNENTFSYLNEENLSVFTKYLAELDIYAFPVYFKIILTGLALLAAFFVITSTNPILSIFNLIVLYIIIAFYLIFIGITYIGISYIVIYIGAIAILFLFIIMMIDIEVTNQKGKNYIPLLFFILGIFF